MAVTHDMIAAKLGINRTTVTKALKGDASIRELTRKKVLETATMMGYDFKQSQQNRREGKRFYVNTDVKFNFIHWWEGNVLGRGQGMLTNLSSTGLLLKVHQTENNILPLGEIGIKLDIQGDSLLRIVPKARVVRFNYMPGQELAAKFDKEDQLSQQKLVEIEVDSFSRMDP